MKNLIFISILILTACSTTYKTGDCVEVYDTFKIGNQNGQLASGEPLFNLHRLESGQKKTTCPSGILK